MLDQGQLSLELPASAAGARLARTEPLDGPVDRGVDHLLVEEPAERLEHRVVKNLLPEPGVIAATAGPRFWCSAQA